MVNHEDQPKVEIDDDGNQFVLINGEKQKVQLNDQGQQYFVNKEGKV